MYSTAPLSPTAPVLAQGARQIATRSVKVLSDLQLMPPPGQDEDRFERAANIIRSSEHAILQRFAGMLYPQPNAYLELLALRELDRHLTEGLMTSELPWSFQQAHRVLSATPFEPHKIHHINYFEAWADVVEQAGRDVYTPTRSPAPTTGGGAGIGWFYMPTPGQFILWYAGKPFRRVGRALEVAYDARMETLDVSLALATFLYRSADSKHPWHDRLGYFAVAGTVLTAGALFTIPLSLWNFVAALRDPGPDKF